MKDFILESYYLSVQLGIVHAYIFDCHALDLLERMLLLDPSQNFANNHINFLKFIKNEELVHMASYHQNLKERKLDFGLETQGDDY